MHWQIASKRRTQNTVETRRAERTADIVWANTNHYSILVHRLAINLKEKIHFPEDKKENLTVSPQVEKPRRIFLLRISKEILG